MLCGRREIAPVLSRRSVCVSPAAPGPAAHGEHVSLHEPVANAPSIRPVVSIARKHPGEKH